MARMSPRSYRRPMTRQRKRETQWVTVPFIRAAGSGEGWNIAVMGDSLTSDFPGLFVDATFKNGIVGSVFARSAVLLVSHFMGSVFASTGYNAGVAMGIFQCPGTPANIDLADLLPPFGSNSIPGDFPLVVPSTPTGDERTSKAKRKLGRGHFLYLYGTQFPANAVDVRVLLGL